MKKSLAAHLFATDISGLSLFDRARDIRCSAVIVPQNRFETTKVKMLTAEAEQRGIPVFQQRRREFPENELPAADIGLSWMYSQILPEAALKFYSLGIMNMHGGRIPEYRGANVLQWAIINGEKEIWVTWHEIVAAVDAGPIWAEAAFELQEDWDARRVRDEMIALGLKIFSDALNRKICGDEPVRYPKLENGRVWPSRRPQDSLLPSDLTERELCNFLRALCPPWPPAIWKGRPVLGLSDTSASGAEPYLCRDGKILYLNLDA